jgi:hypothetical protein
MEKRQPLQQVLLGKLEICLQKTESRSLFVLLESSQSGLGPYYQTQNLEVSTGQKREYTEVIGIGKDFLSRTQAAQQLRERIDKWEYMKLKSFCTTKEMVCKLKKQPTHRMGENLC